MISIVLFGAGNLATHLFKNLSASGKFRIKQVYNHRPESLGFFKDKTAVTTVLKEILPADIYLFALKDEVIPDVTSQLQDNAQLMVHTSGATSIKVFESFKRRGVFYPLQTFSKTKEVEFREVPVCVEAGNPKDLQLLQEMAGEISNRVYKVSSEQRKSLHVAAVFANNFVNHLYSEAREICSKNGLEFKILQPLIKETADKILYLDPEEAQTGPAKRNDLSVINSHLQLLNKEQRSLYKTLTKSIQNRHDQKL
jgi:predicted short-subunit dehydrogenase-like oxidoreductase (DUF2520 family)